METHLIKTFHPLLLAIIVLPLITACVTPQKILADAKVRELCEKNDGITVYETVKLPAERFTKRGSIRIPAKSLAKPEDEYYYDASRVSIRKEYPEIWQSLIKIYRRADGKLLGEAVSYARRGGDIPGPWHPSSFRCPEEAGLNNLKKQIFNTD
jgi:hypothetical protein